MLMPIAARFPRRRGALSAGHAGLRAVSRSGPSFQSGSIPLRGLITWVIGIVIFRISGRLGVFALGYEDLSDALLYGMAWRLAALLLVGKFVSTLPVTASEDARHLLSNLFFGGMCGAVVAGLGRHFVTLGQPDYVLLAVAA